MWGDSVEEEKEKKKRRRKMGEAGESHAVIEQGEGEEEAEEGE